MDEDDDRERELAPAFRRLRGQLQSRLATDRRATPRGRVRRAVPVLAALVLLLGLFSLSPPGRAVAGAIGEWLGVGGEPSVPGFGNQRAVVIGTGEAEVETPYEIVASTDRAQGPESPTCISVGFPALPRAETEAGGLCLTNALKRDLETELFAEGISPTFEAPGLPAQQLIIRVLALPEVSSIEVSYVDVNGERVPVDLSSAQLGDVQGEAIDVADRANFFFGFLPINVLKSEPAYPRCLTEPSVEASLDRIQIESFDADGNPIETRSPVNTIQFVFSPPEGYRSWVSSRLDGPPYFDEDEYCEATSD